MKMRITKEMARETTDKVIVDREVRELKDAENYITAILEPAISRIAEQGRDNLTFHPPATIKDELVLTILRENGFTVEKGRVINSYKISW